MPRTRRSQWIPVAALAIAAGCSPADDTAATPAALADVAGGGEPIGPGGPAYGNNGPGGPGGPGPGPGPGPGTVIDEDAQTHDAGPTKPPEDAASLPTADSSAGDAATPPDDAGLPGWDAPPPEDTGVDPWVDPDSLCGYGTIYGLICSIDTQTFVDGATVWVDATDCEGNPLHVETTSDADGYYTLEGVPSGLQTLHIKRDDFEKSHTVQVKNDKITDVTGVGHKECFQYVDPDACLPGKQNINVEAKTIGGVADIIWFIDTSGSMDEEAEYLQQNINAFATFIGNQAVDFRVVLIAEGFGICVPEPLGGPGCTDGPAFRHIHEPVDSHNGLEQVIDTYDLYKDFLREGATTNFIAVTDDNSDKSANWFNGEVKKKVDPGFSDPFVFHSIVGMGTAPLVGCFGAAMKGSVYLSLSTQTGGATFPICNKDWSSTFGALAESVVETVQTTCGYAVPNPAALANVTSFKLKHDGGGAYTQVAGPEACIQGGWYLVGDEQLFLCPATCDFIKSGVLELSYACD